jgi:hypothetical protein
MRRKPALDAASAANAFESFRELVYLAGVQELAPKMGLKPGTLYNKADSSDDSHHQPTLRDVILVTQITGDTRVLESLDEMFGRASYDCARHIETSDEALLELLTKLGAENGEFHRALSDGLKQKRFTAATLVQIRAEAFDIVSALMVLLERLQGLVDD